MFKPEDILARLQNGQDAGAIAQEFTDALNKAIAEQSAAQNKYQERQEKIVGAQAILNDAFNFVDEFYPDFKIPKEVRDSFTGAALVEIMDEAAADAKQLESLYKAPKAKRTGEEKESDEDALIAFLKQYHLA